jgi:N-alpha-acetyl-L-2,4-diaminobutyrate deacetylase
VFITTELGGGGTSTAKTAGIAKRGVRNVLVKAGMLKGEVEAQATVWLDMPDGNCFSFAEDSGLLEPLVDLGDSVRKGDVVARIYPVGKTGVAPQEVMAKTDGILTARHFPGLVKPGECVSVLAVSVD